MQEPSEHLLDQHFEWQLQKYDQLFKSACNSDKLIIMNWLHILCSAPTSQKLARNSLILLMYGHLSEFGYLEVPFTDMRNCSCELNALLDSYIGLPVTTKAIKRALRSNIVYKKPESCNDIVFKKFLAGKEATLKMEKCTHTSIQRGYDSNLTGLDNPDATRPPNSMHRNDLLKRNQEQRTLMILPENSFSNSNPLSTSRNKDVESSADKYKKYIEVLHRLEPITLGSETVAFNPKESVKKLNIDVTKALPSQQKYSGLGSQNPQPQFEDRTEQKEPTHLEYVLIPETAAESPAETTEKSLMPLPSQLSQFTPRYATKPAWTKKVKYPIIEEGRDKPDAEAHGAGSCESRVNVTEKALDSSDYSYDSHGGYKKLLPGGKKHFKGVRLKLSRRHVKNPTERDTFQRQKEKNCIHKPTLPPESENPDVVRPEIKQWSKNQKVERQMSSVKMRPALNDKRFYAIGIRPIPDIHRSSTNNFSRDMASSPDRQKSNAFAYIRPSESNCNFTELNNFDRVQTGTCTEDSPLRHKFMEWEEDRFASKSREKRAPQVSQTNQRRMSCYFPLGGESENTVCMFEKEKTILGHNTNAYKDKKGQRKSKTVTKGVQTERTEPVRSIQYARKINRPILKPPQMISNKAKQNLKLEREQKSFAEKFHAPSQLKTAPKRVHVPPRQAKESSKQAQNTANFAIGAYRAMRRLNSCRSPGDYGYYARCCYSHCEAGHWHWRSIEPKSVAPNWLLGKKRKRKKGRSTWRRYRGELKSQSPSSQLLFIRRMLTDKKEVILMEMKHWKILRKLCVEHCVGKVPDLSEILDDVNTKIINLIMEVQAIDHLREQIPRF